MRNFGDNYGLDNHIRYFCYYNAHPALLCCFNACFALNRQMTFAGGVGIHNTLFAANGSACREVRARQALDNILESAVRVFND
ncbi:hypothetical protein ES703_65857 [subsurface metagenome]